MPKVSAVSTDRQHDAKVNMHSKNISSVEAFMTFKVCCTTIELVCACVKIFEQYLRYEQGDVGEKQNCATCKHVNNKQKTLLLQSKSGALEEEVCG